MNKAFVLALKEVGTKEIVGTKHNPKILQYFKETGHSWVKNDELAWCSAFFNAMQKRAGLPYTGKLNARSWLTIGEQIQTPQLGCAVIFWRKGKNSPYGHIAYFVSETPTEINVLGGNQNNRVQISAYRKDRLLQYRKIE